MSNRLGLRRIALAAALVALTWAVLAVGCLRRYPAPTDPAPASTPYSSMAVWRQIELPPAGDRPTTLLPRDALRIAVGPGAEDVWADAALIDGRDGAAVAERWPEAAAILRPRAEAIVLLADPLLLGPESAWCERLRGMEVRVVVAAIAPGTTLRPIRPRAAVPGQTRDPLVGLPLTAVCPAP